MRARGRLRVRDVMTTDVVTAPPTATLEEIARTMLEEKIGSVVISDPEESSRPVGILTETDFDVSDEPLPFTFFRWPSAFGKFAWSERSLEDLYEAARRRTAGEVMSRDLVTVAPDAPLWEAVELMLEQGHKRLPVVEAGRLVGIVSRHDLLRCLLPQTAAT